MMKLSSKTKNLIDQHFHALCHDEIRDSLFYDKYMPKCYKKVHSNGGIEFKSDLAIQIQSNMWRSISHQNAYGHHLDIIKISNEYGEVPDIINSSYYNIENLTRKRSQKHMSSAFERPNNDLLKSSGEIFTFFPFEYVMYLFKYYYKYKNVRIKYKIKL